MSHSPSKSTSGDRAKTTQPSEPSKRHSAISNMFSRAQSGHAEEVENHSSSSKRVRLPKIPPVDDQYQMKPEDVLVAVMGMTGSGKSTFINYLSEDDVKIGHKLESCTDKVAVYRAKMQDGSRVFLMDTPGFDDTFKSDTTILREIASWLTDTYSKKLLLSGIVYLHRIQDVRFTGAAMKNLRMFKNLCGNDGLGNVILTTTAWGGVTEEEGCAREKQLREEERFWKPMIDAGSEIYRHDSEEQSARLILDHLVSKKNRIRLAIQHEMQDKKLSLEETAAGKEVEAQMEKMKAEWTKERDQLKSDMQKAVAASDKEAQRQIREERREIEKKMRESDENVRRLKVNNEELAAQLRRHRRKTDAPFDREERREGRFYRRFNPWHKRWDDNISGTDSDGYDSEEYFTDSSVEKATRLGQKKAGKLAVIPPPSPPPSTRRRHTRSRGSGSRERTTSRGLIAYRNAPL